VQSIVAKALRYEVLSVIPEPSTLKAYLGRKMWFVQKTYKFRAIMLSWGRVSLCRLPKMTHMPEAAIRRYYSRFLVETMGLLSKTYSLCPKRAANF
jgi:hypothetical protein